MRIALKRYSTIGLDVGSRAVKAVQLSRAGREQRIVACASFPRAGPEAVPTAAELREVRSILRRQGFVGRDVVIAAAGDKLRSGILELPAKAAGVPMDQIARAEFGRVHKLDVNAAELSWWELPASSRAAKGTSVMAVAYPHADAEPHVSAFDEAGFRVRGVDTPTSAVARGCLPLAAGKRSFGTLELGASAAVLVLVRDGIVVYERRIPDAGTGRLLAELEARLGAGRDAAEHVLADVGLSPAGAASANDDARFASARELIARHVDASLAEVRRTLAYASHQYANEPVELLLLCGGGACLPGLRDYVAANIAAEVRVAAFDPAPTGDEDACLGAGPSMACAVGLARFP
jgi:type IV pilus assembly protein PilM